MSRTPLFEIRGLVRRYRLGETAIEALRGVDLDVFRGEVLVLLGPSGSGKSTFLNLVGALDRADAGTVRFEGIDLGRLSERERTRLRRRRFGFVFQFFNLIASLTARENVALVAELVDDPLPPEEALARVGLAHRLDHFPAQLSGGEQQRVAVARAIVKRPDVLLADEPTGALDSRTGVGVLEALLRARDELGTTLILVTHNRAVAAIADRVVHFADGRIARIERNPRPLPPAAVSW
ncbi:Macrolide export ATP-binding/permease protein MacB [bacterium HR39]|nr:Macrolide export ATP-binding/permease protein MacB [bacterium HR39]